MIQTEDITLLLELEVVTPVHVGAAAEQHWQKGLDFIEKEGQTFVYTFDKLKKLIPVDALTTYLLNNNYEGIASAIKDGIEEASFRQFNMPTSNPEIRRFLFNSLTGKPLLPGSSLKGAIRSSIVRHFLKQSNQLQPNEVALLGNFQTSVLRFLQVPDFQFTKSILANSKIFNLQQGNHGYVGGWKHGRNQTNGTFLSNGFNTFYECLSPGDKSFASLSFKKTAAKQLLNQGRQTPPTPTHNFLRNFQASTLFQLINAHTIRYLTKEITFFETYAFENASREVLNKLKELKARAEKLDSSQACMLRMAAGSGFHSITGDWKFDDFVETGEHTDGRRNGIRRYKSRKVAIYRTATGESFAPMGFIILKQTTALAQAAYLEQLQQEKNKQLQLQAEKEEATRLAAEEAKKPKMLDAPPTNSLEVDAIVVQTGKPLKVNIFLKGFEDKIFTMTECQNFPIGTICRATLVAKKGKIERVIFKAPK